MQATEGVDVSEPVHNQPRAAVPRRVSVAECDEVVCLSPPWDLSRVSGCWASMSEPRS